jgi:glucosamine-6-phosphate deaminase
MNTSDRNWSLKVLPDAMAAAEAAADVIAATIRSKSDAVISVPTGSTPLGMFDVLAARVARGEIDFSAVEIVCLDEYVGVTLDHPASLTRWLWDALLHRIEVKPQQVHSLPSASDDPITAAMRYEEMIAERGGLALAVLGLGPNGHIGYNEPGSSADSRTRVITLTPESVEQASAYWEGAVPIPNQAMTMGVGTLLESKKIVLLVTGESKAEILRRALEEPMSADVPASWLRLAGSRLTVMADEEAASRVTAVHSG